MNVAQLREFYKVENNHQLAKEIKKSRSLMTLWEQEGIPPRTQTYFQVITKGKLKVDPQVLTA